jgi:hypothetical protein
MKPRRQEGTLPPETTRESTSDLSQNAKVGGQNDNKRALWSVDYPNQTDEIQ